MTIRLITAASALPAQTLTNQQLADKFNIDTNDEWIQSRTGISQRHMISGAENTFTLALESARKALASANISPEQIGLIIVATTTPTKAFPSVASMVQQELGIVCPAFDLAAACSGFIHGLSVAQNMMEASKIGYALLIGADTYTTLMNWQDRTSCVLFGDGAGAVVLKRDELSANGIQAIEIGGDGNQQQALTATDENKLIMEGRTVYKVAVPAMVNAAEKLLAQHKLSISDIDLLVPHQANARMLEAIAERLKLPAERVIMTVGQHANTSAASIPLALAQAQADGRLKEGQQLLMLAFGAGFAFGGALVKWG